MNCDELRNDLMSYLYGELDEQRVTDVEAHVRSCTRCGEEIAALRQTMAAMDQWKDVDVSIDETGSTDAISSFDLESREVRSGSRGWVCPALIGALAAVLVFAALVGLAARIERRDGTLSITFLDDGRSRADVEPVGAGKSQFLLLLTLPMGATSGGDPHEEQRLVKEYRDWALGIDRTGRFIEGRKLTEARRVLARDIDGEVVAVVGSSPSTDSSSDVLTGYFRIAADSVDDALSIARTCPHLSHGGAIEVREVDSRTRGQAQAGES